jgi:phage-related minor tail protein
MADRIKGITIELDGETTGLKKALSGVTQQSIDIQKELTDVNRLLKFDPGNTEALAQKQELLSKQIEVTSQKLNTLKDAQSQVDAQFAKGDIGEAQYRAFQREIEFTEASLNKFKTSYQDAMNPPKGDITKPIKDLEEEAQKSQGIFDNMGNYIKRGIGMAIGGDIWDKAKEGIGELITFGGDWQKSLNGIQAQTGATTDEMAKFNDQIEAVYNNNFGSSVEDVADSFAEVRQYMQGTGEDLQTVTQNAIGFRDTFGVEVPESMRSVQALMKQFGLTSEEAFNLLAQGQQKGLNYSDELFDSVNEYSVQFGKLGLNAQDMFNIFASGAQNGAFNLDKVGDAVKELSIRVIDGSTTTQAGFQALGLNASQMAEEFGAGGDSAKAAFYQVIDGLKNIQDPVQQSIAGVDLFGTQWEDLGPTVITSLGSVQGAFDQTKNSMDQINQVKYNTPIEALDGLGRQIKTSVLLPVSQELMPTLNDAASQLSQTFSSSDLKSGIESLSQGLGELIKTIADIAANVLPSLLTGLGWIMDNANTIATGIIAIGTAMEVLKVANIINGVVTAFQTAQAATEGLTAAQWLLNVAMEANPIGIIIAAITGLVAALIYLWNTNEGFKNAIIGAWTAISGAAISVFNGIISFFTTTIPNAFSGFATFFTTTVPQTFQDGWNSVINFFY